MAQLQAGVVTSSFMARLPDRQSWRRDASALRIASASQRWVYSMGSCGYPHRETDDVLTKDANDAPWFAPATGW